MTRSLLLLALAAGIAGCVQRPPNNTTAEGQAFYACDRPALDQTADIDSVISQLLNRENVRRECLASGNIPPLPGIRFVEAPVVQAPLPPQPEAPVRPELNPPSVLPGMQNQNFQPPAIIAPNLPTSEPVDRTGGR